MKLGFDFDGVITKPKKSYLKFANGLDETEEMKPLMLLMLRSNKWKEYTSKLAPMNDIDILQKLCSKHKIYIISRRLEGDRNVVRLWLKKNKINVLSKNIRLRKNLDVDLIEHKINSCKDLDIYWDDSEKIIDEVAKIGINCGVFISWKDVLKTIERIEKRK